MAGSWLRSVCGGVTFSNPRNRHESGHGEGAPGGGDAYHFKAWLTTLNHNYFTFVHLFTSLFLFLFFLTAG